jgi:hypothetical protein
MLVQSVIGSRLCYCNSARLITEAGRLHRTAPILREIQFRSASNPNSACQSGRDRDVSADTYARRSLSPMISGFQPTSRAEDALWQSQVPSHCADCLPTAPLTANISLLLFRKHPKTTRFTATDWLLVRLRFSRGAKFVQYKYSSLW